MTIFTYTHSSHLSLHLSAFCMAHRIELAAVLPNARHLFQLMAIAVFHALKTIWRQKIINFQINNEGSEMQ